MVERSVVALSFRSVRYDAGIQSQLLRNVSHGSGSEKLLFIPGSGNEIPRWLPGEMVGRPSCLGRVENYDRSAATHTQ